MHLRWLGLPLDEPIIEASVTLEVVQPPAVPHLYFWALQASFFTGSSPAGAGHLGLQWYPAHPGSTAVNWGGYDAAGHELAGSASDLPSVTDNPNTRDFRWQPGRPYRLSIRAGAQPGTWQGSVDGRVVRDLMGGGTRLADVMVWSEVFAQCDDPSVVVRWSDFSIRGATGTGQPDRLAVSYQSRFDGGCANTSVHVTGGVAEQATNVSRATPAGAVLAC
ncbi:MAG: hypothetical protein M3Z46_04575 [Actinomycetota bacterium]|nr:hypothetical protein [Actinomycetota bacterium]